MKIVLTGGGTGGHFYPLIAVAEAINDIADSERIAQVKMYYLGHEKYDAEALFQNHIEYRYVPAGKLRIYFSIKNFFDFFKTLAGIFQAFITVFSIYPDVIFSKGGFVAFPTLLAGRILGIPIILHESDSVPGRVNIWTGKFAKKIALSYKEAYTFFPKQKTVHTGQPVRKQLLHPQEPGAYEFLKLERHVPILLIIGGSLGARIINETLMIALPKLVEKYQIIHQTGKQNYDEVKKITESMLRESDYRHRYTCFPFLDPLALRMSASVAKLVITRAGSQLFEIASWNIPAIIIPITESQGDHQRKNAFNYARTGAGVVIEEENFTPSILSAEIQRILDDTHVYEKMISATHTIQTEQASEKIARQVITLGLSHEV